MPHEQVHESNEPLTIHPQVHQCACGHMLEQHTYGTWSCRECVCPAFASPDATSPKYQCNEPACTRKVFMLGVCWEHYIAWYESTLPPQPKRRRRGRRL